MYLIINALASYSLLISIALIFRNRQRIQGAMAIMVFVACAFLYLIIDWVWETPLFEFLVLGPLMLPFTFWYMAKSMFRDQKPSKWIEWTLVLLTAATYYGLYLAGQFDYTDLAALALRTLSIFFVILAIIEAQHGSKSDLDEKRIKLRKYFTYFIGIIVILTVVSELGMSPTEQEVPRLVQRTSILIFNTLFIGLNFNIRNTLFDAPRKSIEIKNPDIVEKIQSSMSDLELFKKDSLTIGKLSEEIGLQEYK
ncbi:MAG: hypothetical protein ABJQ96_09270, partial [Crocinitomicaceae bacterium]